MIRPLLCGCGAMLLATALLAAAPHFAVAAQGYDATDRYAAREVAGWRVLMHNSLLAEHAEPGKRALVEMEHQLYGIERRLPADVLKQLRQVPIWLEFNEPHHPAAVYHPDAGWLREHDMNPEKAQAVEISNAGHFLDDTLLQPYVLLHELAHAYQDRFLSAEQKRELQATFDKAQAGKQYESVLHASGQKIRHYALTNCEEYFAEATEAYFGTNDFYPFVRSELAEHDPILHELLGHLWQVAPQAAR